jgi:hypothetical protein
MISTSPLALLLRVRHAESPGADAELALVPFAVSMVP